MESVSVLSCRCCMFVSCVHPVAVLNAAFCMTCSLLMLVEDAIGDHTEEAYSRAGLITALYVTMSVSFCLPHPVASSALLFIVRSRLLVYSAGSGVNRVQVVLSGFSKRLFCFVQAKTLCMYGCMYFGCTRTCVCGCNCDVVCIGHDLNRCTGCW